MNETIVDRIRALCLKNKTSITKIEVELGYANGTIGKWAKAKRKPPLEKVMAVADLLHTTSDYLYNGDGPAAQMGNGAVESTVAEIINLYRQLWPENKKQVLDYARFLLGNQESADARPLKED